MQMPKCCGIEMKPSIETAKFLETQCEICKDVVYVKKTAIERPQMLDD